MLETTRSSIHSFRKSFSAADSTRERHQRVEAELGGGGGTIGRGIGVGSLRRRFGVDAEQVQAIVVKLRGAALWTDIAFVDFIVAIVAAAVADLGRRHATGGPLSARATLAVAARAGHAAALRIEGAALGTNELACVQSDHFTGVAA